MEQFTRDFGYLEKFLVNMAKHAETLPPERGGRLKQIMAEESSRWEEVKRLLAGSAPTAPTMTNVASPASPAPAPASAVPPASALPPAAVPPLAPTGLTVGSLMGVPKK